MSPLLGLLVKRRKKNLMSVQRTQRLSRKLEGVQPSRARGFEVTRPETESWLCLELAVQQPWTTDLAKLGLCYLTCKMVVRVPTSEELL